MAEGHPDARWYPVAMLWAEALLAEDRVTALEGTRATLLQAAIISVLSKSGSGYFTKLLQKLTGGG